MTRFSSLLCLFVLIALTLFAYWPGLQGPFLFDDYFNLSKLGDLGGVDNWETFSAFVFGGTAGPLGRPLSLVSFLLNAQDWPADPYWFKLTNLVVHLATGALIYLVVIRLLALCGDGSAEAFSGWGIAAFVAGFWLLHPFLVSTTLYVVQRMAQLAALFCIAGMYTYLRARSGLNSNPERAYFWMTTSVVLFGGAAALSKENGALLPVLLLSLEQTVLKRHQPQSGVFKVWHFTFLVLPSAVIAGYLLYLFFKGDPFAVSMSRGFSVYERVITEWRILLDYLYNWFVPSMFSAELYHDDFVKSQGLLEPISTVASLAIHFSLLVVAWLCNRRAPLISFGILFFYAGHLIESTAVSLELYFAHRNYLPTAFLILPVAVYISRLVSLQVRYALSVAILGIMLAFTHYSARVWSSFDRIMIESALSSPNSSRSVNQASMVLSNRGSSEAAISLVEHYLKKNPDDLGMQLWSSILQCTGRGRVEDATVESLSRVFPGTPYDLRDFQLYSAFIKEVVAADCPPLSPVVAQKLLESSLELPANSAIRSARFAQTSYFLGEVSLLRGEIEAATEYYRSSLNARRNPDAAMAIAANLASAGYYEEALAFSGDAKTLIDVGILGDSGQTAPTWVKNIDAFESQVMHDMASGQ